MLIKPLKILIKCVLLLLLVLALVGLILPQSYSVNKTIEINANLKVIKPLITDFSQWQKWSPWEKVDPSIRFTLGEPSSGLGAHQSWKGKWGYGEMIITSISQNKVSFNILLNAEHIIRGTFNLSEQNGIVTLICNIKGQTTAPLISGYTAILSEYVLSNTVSLGLNNLQTVAQLSDPQRIMHSHDSQNSTGEN
ncbi:SRPBCC family protein [Pseudoalteromonas sp. NZS71]|uniref:SRPBCC family protein n=1 Tax=unclassified Pseudoalteromonas TaxID=194690 RepID=UPI00040BFFBF|nr:MULTISPECIES: SRPBCC family protein [unclassified Pseudoalteromonas]MBH0060994.1 SRPBCC family protein [Pseudoalteromonas sp. NZS71]